MESIGAPAGIRTPGPLIKSQLLYQLSYWRTEARVVTLAAEIVQDYRSHRCQTARAIPRPSEAFRCNGKIV